MLCCRDYDERVVDSFPYQIQYEHYIGNRYVSIECIALDPFSAQTYTETSGTPQARTRHIFFIHFCLMTENSILP